MKTLKTLHEVLAEELLKRVQDPEAKSSDLNVARQFLKDNGIEGNRMVVKGYGNTEMLFEEPINIHQEEANRRVEIKIID